MGVPMSIKSRPSVACETAQYCANNSTATQQTEPIQINQPTRCKYFSSLLLDVNKKVQLDATVCRHLFTAESLYMFRASQRPSSGVLKTVTATSGIGHNTGRATSFQRGLIRTRWKEVAVPVL